MCGDGETGAEQMERGRSELGSAGAGQIGAVLARAPGKPVGERLGKEAVGHRGPYRLAPTGLGSAGAGHRRSGAAPERGHT